MSPKFQTHMFWAYGNFSNLEKISTNSFLAKDYQLSIWTYGDLSNAPARAHVRDAREILPESLFFELSNGSCAPFSDFFRYAVLNKIGGLWVDTDVIALRRPQFDEPFLVTERLPVGTVERLVKQALRRGVVSSRVNNNVIFNPAPSRGNIIDLAFLYSEHFPKNKIQWGELGPALLAAIERIYPNHGFIIKTPEFANPIDFWETPRALLEPGVRLSSAAAFLHLYNQTWNDSKIDKNAPFPKRSLMSLFAEEYL
jgi:hypothetical protein